MRRRRRLAHVPAIALLVAASAGCGRKVKDEAPCPVVANRLFTIANEALAAATVDPGTRRAVADQIPAMRDALAHACTVGAWSAQVRNCMANAPGHTELQACQLQLTQDQRTALDRAARGETSSH